MSRVIADAYYTGDRLATVLVDAIPLASLGTVLEPSAGGGSFLRALLASPKVDPGFVHALDLVRSAEGLQLVPEHRRTVGDFLTETPMIKEPPLVMPLEPDTVIGNPPYNQAEAHARRALELSNRHVFLLLRLAFLSSQGRRAFWKEFPARRVWVLSERPSFTPDGKTDRYDYAWFWWDKAWIAAHDQMHRPFGRLDWIWEWRGDVG